MDEEAREQERIGASAGAKWIAVAIVIAAVLISLTIWVSRPKLDPQSSQVACEQAGGEWRGDLNRWAESMDLPVLEADCVFDE